MQTSGPAQSLYVCKLALSGQGLDSNAGLWSSQTNSLFAGGRTCWPWARPWVDAPVLLPHLSWGRPAHQGWPTGVLGCGEGLCAPLSFSMLSTGSSMAAELQEPKSEQTGDPKGHNRPHRLVSAQLLRGTRLASRLWMLSVHVGC